MTGEGGGTQLINTGQTEAWACICSGAQACTSTAAPHSK
eukprot:CAMPEP_0179955772 /NCGR_PEP_ID=MMETSP0983-20121128/26471_1 /TAXON_ID=483367 /ORGANISM="non described non described, Strain CCMP 2436" /LENGTH=38 /DNA_ID= /DNA_START= /DNA_END= /DNA_ORIENTATION=